MAAEIINANVIPLEPGEKVEVELDRCQGIVARSKVFIECKDGVVFQSREPRTVKAIYVSGLIYTSVNNLSPFIVDDNDEILVVKNDGSEVGIRGTKDGFSRRGMMDEGKDFRPGSLLSVGGVVLRAVIRETKNQVL